MENRKKLKISYLIVSIIFVLLITLFLVIIHLKVKGYYDIHQVSLDTMEDFEALTLYVRSKFFFFLLYSIGFLILLPIFQSIYLYISFKGIKFASRRYDRYQMLIWFISIGLAIFSIIWYLDQFHEIFINLFKFGMVPVLVTLNIFFGYKKV